MSDGHNVVLPAAVKTLAEQLRDRGFNPIGIDLNTLFKGGASVMCCTLELRP